MFRSMEFSTSCRTVSSEPRLFVLYFIILYMIIITDNFPYESSALLTKILPNFVAMLFLCPNYGQNYFQLVNLIVLRPRSPLQYLYYRRKVREGVCPTT